MAPGAGGAAGVAMGAAEEALLPLDIAVPAIVPAIPARARPVRVMGSTEQRPWGSS